jgi:hypothetical protein
MCARPAALILRRFAFLGAGAAAAGSPAVTALSAVPSLARSAAIFTSISACICRKPINAASRSSGSAVCVGICRQYSLNPPRLKAVLTRGTQRFSLGALIRVIPVTPGGNRTGSQFDTPACPATTLAGKPRSGALPDRVGAGEGGFLAGLAASRENRLLVESGVLAKTKAAKNGYASVTPPPNNVMRHYSATTEFERRVLRFCVLETDLPAVVLPCQTLGRTYGAR